MTIKTILQFYILFFALNLWGANNPNIGYCFPAGGCKGTTIIVTIGGQAINDAKSITFGHDELTGVITEFLPSKKEKKNQSKDQENQQLSEKIKARITIGKNIKPGLYDLRVVSKNGISNRIFFEVGQYLETQEGEPNNKIENANAIDLPTTVNGQILPEDIDYYTFTAQKGANIVCNTSARKLTPYLADAVPGWFQPIIMLLDDKGKEVAYCDDNINSPDPVIIYKIAETGSYRLKIHDAIYRGREDFIYRIDIGEIPHIKSIFPIGGEKGKKCKITIDAVNIPKTEIALDLRKNAAGKTSYSYKNSEKLWSNSIDFMVYDYKNVVEQKENNNITTAQPLEINCAVQAKIEHFGDEDWFSIKAKKGESIRFAIDAHKLNSPLDAEMKLYDHTKVELASNDDFMNKNESLETHHADCELLYLFKKPGMYFIRIRDIRQFGGENYAYQFVVEQPNSNFELSLTPSSVSIPQGGTATFNITTYRKNGFKGNVAIETKNLPNNYNLNTTEITNGCDQLLMSISAPNNAEIGSSEIVFFGKSVNGDETIKKIAKPAETQMQAFIYLHQIPTENFMVEITPKLPFSITTNAPKTPITTTGRDTITLEVYVNRAENYKEPIQLVLQNQPKGVRMKPVVLEPNQTNATIEIEIPFTKKRQLAGLTIAAISRVKINKKTTTTTAVAPVFYLKTDK